MTTHPKSLALALCAAIVCATVASGVIAGKKQRPQHKAAAVSSATAGSAGSAPTAAGSARAASSPAPVAKGTPGKEPREAKADTSTKPGGPAQPVARQESRIEFDERMVQGQSASGAIYLFQRSPSEFRSIVQVPDGFRERTVEVLAPRRDQP